MPCSPVEVHRYFKGIYCLHLQDSRVSQARIQKEAGGKQNKPSNSSCRLRPISFLLGSFFNPEDGGCASGLLPDYMTLYSR
jgi:hypothetical protein